ncbi:MAG: exosortase-associated EpsI family protein, partial [Planctomycetota bacterium]
ADAWAAVIESSVPQTIGPWQGVDMPVTEREEIVSGAAGHVSRRYQHAETGEVVDLWLIVGHMQGVTRHTPDVCYRSSGYSQQTSRDRYTFEVEGQPPAEFWTSWFQRDAGPDGILRRRVFWAWTLPKADQPIKWKAPGQPRYAYAGAKALFKMYFTTEEPEDSPPLTENPSNELAKVMIPLIADVLEKGLDQSGPDVQTSPKSAADADGEGLAGAAANRGAA